MIMCIDHGDYSVTVAETNWMKNAQLMNFITKFSEFHRVFCTDDGHMGRKYI